MIGDEGRGRATWSEVAVGMQVRDKEGGCGPKERIIVGWIGFSIRMGAYVLELTEKLFWNICAWFLSCRN